MPRNDTADRIAAAAEEILVAEGAAAVTMRRVAADAGVTTMASYRHYPNREALLSTVVDQAFARLGETWSLRDSEPDFETRFFGLLDDFVDFVIATPNLFSYLMTEPRRQARQFPSDYRTSSPAFAPVVTAVEHGIATGALAAGDPLEVGLGMVAQSMGLAQLYIAGRLDMSPQQFRDLVNEQTKRLLNGYKV